MNQENETKAKPKKTVNYVRVDMPKQPPHIRRRNFQEVAHGYTPDLAVAEALRCLQCRKPFCVDGCPVEINIPGFIRCIAAREFTGAIRVLKEKNCLPAVCGRVCPQERPWCRWSYPSARTPRRPFPAATRRRRKYKR